MGNIIGAIILGVIAIVCFVFSFLHFSEKGFLLNNAYIHASKQERKNMDKKPRYKQSGVVFALTGLVFSINAAECVLLTGWLHYTVIVIMIVAMVYAVVSSVMTDKRQK